MEEIIDGGKKNHSSDRAPSHLRPWGVIGFCVAVVLAMQLVQITRPFRGHFGSYQTTMADMSRNMLEENFRDVFRPKLDQLMFTTEKSYHLNQYPLPSLLVALAIKFLGGSFEFWGRFQSMIFNLLSVWLLWGIVRKQVDEATATIASVLFLFSPYSVIYGQIFCCEPLALCCFLASWRMVLMSSPERKDWFKLSGSAFLFSMALVNRVHFILFLPPLIYSVWRFSRSLKAVLFYLLLSFALPVAWYGFTHWASTQNMIRTYTSLFFQASTSDLLWGTSLFSLEYWKRIFDVFALNMLTPLVFPFFLIGLVFAFQDTRRSGLLLAMFGFGFLTVLLFPQKLMEQDFYLQALFPFVIIFAAIGVKGVASRIDPLRKKRIVLLAMLCFLGVSARYFLHPLYSCPPGERRVAEVGKWIQTQTRPSDILILTGQDAATLSYYTHRRTFGLALAGNYPLPSFLKKRTYNAHDGVEIDAYENASKDSIAFLEFLRNKGAGYILILDRTEAERSPELLQYLRSHYADISPQEASFIFFKL